MLGARKLFLFAKYVQTDFNSVRDKSKIGKIYKVGIIFVVHSNKINLPLQIRLVYNFHENWYYEVE